MNKQNKFKNKDQESELLMMMVVNDLSRCFRREMRKVCEDNGVPVGYRNLLYYLAENNGCNQRLLSEKTGLKPSTVSIAIEKMERDGYVSRERNCLDSRAMNVHLTEKGLDIDRMNKKRVEELEKQFSEKITPEERQTVIEILDKVMRGYCEEKEIPYPLYQGYSEEHIRRKSNRR